MHGPTSASDIVSALLPPLVDGDRLAREIGEPLQQSAPIGFEIAQRLCERDGPTSCRTYHAMWQYLRLTGVHRSLRVDGPLFVAAAERLALSGRLNRVLVSGTADYSMLAHIAHGGRRGGRVPSFHVVDKCNSTLRLNEWYGEQRDIDVGTFRSEILAFQPERQYDLICTHSFLGFHSLADRQTLFRRWGEWLAPGGRLCFSNPVSDRPVPPDLEGRSRRLASKIDVAIERLAELGVALPCARSEFEELIREAGLRRKVEAPAMSQETICSWIAEAGLEIEIAVPVTKAIPGELDLPGISNRGSDRPRIWFQARRP